MNMRKGLLSRSECHRAAKMLQSYLDGELDPTNAAIMASHLEFCRRCGLALSTYRSIKTVIAAVSPSPVDAAAIDRLRAFADQLEASGGEDPA